MERLSTLRDQGPAAVFAAGLLTVLVAAVTGQAPVLAVPRRSPAGSDDTGESHSGLRLGSPVAAVTPSRSGAP
jgi:hypothetical protein